MKHAWRIAGGVAGLLLAAYFLWYCQRNLDLDQLAAALGEPRMAAALACATLCYISMYPLTGWAWHHLLAKQSEDRPPLQLALWIGITQLAKYIPGNIAQHASRAYIALRNGVPARALVVTSIQEMLLALICSILLGAGALALGTAHLNDIRLEWALRMLLLGSIAGSAVFCLDLKAHNASTLPGWMQAGLRLIGGLPGWKVTLRCMAAFAANYLLIGLGIWLLANALGMGDSITYPEAVAVFSLSWALGFLAPGAPAGLGAREGIMLLILQGHGPAEKLVLLTLLARLMSMAGDFLMFLVSSCINLTMKSVQDRQ